MLIKYFKNASFVLLLLLFATSINAHTFFQPQHTAAHKPVERKNQSKPRMFLIAVIDSDDETIGERCDADLDDISYTFTELAGWMFMDIDSKIIKGDDFSKASVNSAIDNWLENMQPTANDIVVFYYSGHGFRDSTDASKYPRMWLKTNSDKDVETNNLQLEEVYNRIVEKGAGTNLILADCCNTTNAGGNANYDNIQVPARKRVTHKREQNSNSEDDGLDNAEKLFTPGQPISILANAAGKGEFAAGKADIGGFFTYYFTEALEQCAYDNTVQPSWQSIFKYADGYAGYKAQSAPCANQAKHNPQGRCVQTAVFDLYEL